MEKKKIRIKLIFLIVCCFCSISCKNNVQINVIEIKEDFSIYQQNFSKTVKSWNDSSFVFKNIINYDTNQTLSIKDIIQICEKEYKMTNQAIVINYKTKSVVGAYFSFDYNYNYELVLSFSLDSIHYIKPDNIKKLKEKLEILLNTNNFILFQYLSHKPFKIPEEDIIDSDSSRFGDF